MEISFSELKELLGAGNAVQPTVNRDLPGTHIAVLDRGFVYVGKCSIQGDIVRIENARNIRVWGTTKGLGELVNGPTSKTVTDDVGTIIAPYRAIIHLIECKREW